MPQPNAIAVDIQGLDLAIDSLNKIPKRVNDWSKKLQTTIGLIIQSEVDQVFDSAPDVRSGGQVYNGETWAALSDATLRSNPRREGGKILRDYGELLQSLQVRGRGNILTSDANSITFGTNLPKAVALNYGADINRAAGTRSQNFRVDRRTGQNRFASRRRANFQQDVSVPASNAKISARPFLVPTQAMADLVAAAIAQYFKDGST